MKDDITLEVLDWVKRVIDSCKTKEHLDAAFALTKLYKDIYDPALNVWHNIIRRFTEREEELNNEIHRHEK